MESRVFSCYAGTKRTGGVSKLELVPLYVAGNPFLSTDRPTSELYVGTHRLSET
jgi:hypothetical protein